MQESNWTPHSRTTRLHEWLLILLLLGLAAGVRAESVYKCIDAQGGVAYQSQPCAAQQQASVIKLLPASAYTPSPHYRVERPARETATHQAPRDASAYRHAPAPATSFECRVSDGQVFYRHTPCPRSIAARDASSGSKMGRGSHSGSSGSGRTLSVSSRRVSREEACQQVHRAGAVGRAGHEHDEDISTYDRNLGRDPCR